MAIRSCGTMPTGGSGGRGSMPCSSTFTASAARKPAYVLSTFPIVRAQEEAAFGRYLTRDLILAHMSALAAGTPMP